MGWENVRMGHSSLFIKSRFVICLLLILSLGIRRFVIVVTRFEINKLSNLHPSPGIRHRNYGFILPQKVHH